MAILRRKSRKASIQEENQIREEGLGEVQLDKSFGYSTNFGAKFELGREVGRGHFGHTFWAKGKKGDLKGKPVAVKIISKSKVRLVQYSFLQLNLFLDLVHLKREILI